MARKTYGFKDKSKKDKELRLKIEKVEALIMKGVEIAYKEKTVQHFDTWNVTMFSITGYVPELLETDPVLAKTALKSLELKGKLELNEAETFIAMRKTKKDAVSKKSV